MTKLISGRIAKVTSANVSAERYQFIGLSETEPDLGLPAVSGYVLSSDTNGNRIWIDPISAAAGVPYFANTSGIANVALTANIANTVLSLNNFTTANLVESINLYYTNARVLSAVTPYLTTANVLESASNLYYTNARVISAVLPYLTTSNVAEGTNLYYTNTRVYSNVITTLAGNILIGNASVGNISVSGSTIFGAGTGGSLTGANLISSDNIQTGNLSALSGNILITGNIIPSADSRFNFGSLDKQWKDFYLSAESLYVGGQKISGNTETGLTLVNLTASNITTGNLVVTRSLVGNVTGTVSSLSNFTTSNLTEGTALYYTNARVNSNVIAFLPSLAGSGIQIQANGQINANTQVLALSSLAQFLTTSNVAEGGNLYYTNARVISAVLPYLTTSNVAEGGNLYYTNARVYSNVITLLPTLAGSGIQIQANGQINANATVLSLATLAPFLTTSNVSEGSNLYFTNTRAVSAFTAGKGIIIQENGIIKTATAPAEFNLYIDGSSYGNVLSTMSTMVTMPSATAADRFILRSIHVTNISDTTDALLSGNVLYATGNTAMLINRIPIPVGGVVDLMKRGQLLSPGDKINLQGFTSAGTATSNLLSAMFTYETLAADSSYIGIGQTLVTSNTNILVYDSDQAASIIESIKIVNLQDSIIPVKLYWGDANGLVKTHLAYNLSVPSNSSIELLQNPKRIEKTDRLYASYRNAANNSISIFTSARLTATFALASYAVNVTPGSSPLISIATTEGEGTILYYSIE